MPYASNADVPTAVRKRYSGECLSVWRRVFNDTHKRTSDEGRSSATAEVAARNCKAAKAEEAVAELSFNQRQELVRNAVRGAYGQNSYVAELYDDRAIFETYSEDGPTKYWEVGYTLDEEAMTVELGGERTEVVRETTYRAVKFLDEDKGLIEGLAIPFYGPVAGKDLVGEYFSPATDLCPEWFPDGRPLLYHHGLDGTLKTAVVGRQVDADEREEGVWVKGELDKASRYRSRVAQIVRSGKAGFSSGSIPHLVSTKSDGLITRWPWVELSITPTPAHPGAMVYAVKSADLPAFTDSDEHGSGSEPFDTHAERVASEVENFVDRVRTRIDLRAAKAGRELSEGNRKMLTALLERISSFDDLRREIKEALDRTDPVAKKSLVDLEAELVISELRRAGVEV